jgi:hypothetical protein
MGIPQGLELSPVVVAAASAAGVAGSRAKSWARGSRDGRKKMGDVCETTLRFEDVPRMLSTMRQLNHRQASSGDL